MDDQTPVAPDPADITPAQQRAYDQMLKYGLHYEGGGHLPDFPMGDLTPQQAAARIPDPLVLQSVLAAGQTKDRPGYFTVASRADVAEQKQALALQAQAPDAPHSDSGDAQVEPPPNPTPADATGQEASVTHGG